MLKILLEYALLFDLSYFFSFGIYHKAAVKVALAIGIALYILLRLIISKKRFIVDFFPATFLNKPIFIFLGVAFVSTLLSPNFRNSQDIFFQRYIYYFLFFFLAAYLAKDRKYFLVLFFLFLISTFIVSIGGIRDLLNMGLQRAYENLFSQMTRLYTSFNIPAFFAAYFLYSIPLFLIVILLHSNLRIKLLAGIGITPLAICLFFHFSRSTWIVLSLAVFIYFLFLNGHKWMGVFIAYFILSVIFILPPFRERLFSISTLSPSSWGDRVAMWDSAFNIFKEFPFFGVGPGNYSSFMYKVVPANFYKEGLRHLHAHDTYLELLAEIGLFGLISFLFIFFTFFRKMFKRIKIRENYIDIAFLIMVIAVMLGELTASTVMVGVYNACLFWFLMGLAVGRQEETEKGTVPFGDSPFFNWMFSNKHPFRWVFFITGAGGIIAQVILMRELLVGFYGNELTIGIILANWVILEALGVIAGGWIIKRAKNKLNIFTLFTVIFSILLIVLIFLARTFKPILGLPQGEGVGILNILLISGLALFPVAFCHGVLFNCGTSIFSSLGWAYAWETAGTIAGGLIITYIFLPHVGSFSAASILAVLSIGSCFLIRKYLNKGMVYFCATSGFLIFVLFLLGGANKLESISIAKEWNKENVISYRNSLYGNIAITKKSGQTTLFYNGQPVIVAPYPDITFIEEFGNLPLLFHPYPKNVLIIGSGVGGLIKETLKHSDIKVDYTEIDPAIIQSVKDYFDKSARGELANARVHTINNDGRFFLRNTRNHYDVIIIGVSRVSDLTENRFFTFEFFLLAKQKLNQGGILAFWLPGSLSYLSHDLKDLNACVLNSLIQAYPFVRVIPGDYNIFLASSSKDILAVTPVMIEERISARHIFTQSLIPSYLLYRLDPGKVIWFGQALSGATKSMNLDLKPLAVFKSLVLWNKQFSPIFANFLDFLEKINLSHILTTILFLTAAIAFVFLIQRRPQKLAFSYSIFTTGFFGMLINLMLIFSFQVFTGYLYYKIGVLVALFMAGSASGSIIITKSLKLKEYSVNLFIGMELAIILYTLICAGLIYYLANSSSGGFLIFSALLFGSGMFLGIEFPLAGKLYQGEKEQLPETCAALYGADLLGGWIAGICGGVFFLPILGVFNTCLVIALLKLSSLSLLISVPKTFDK